jgi:hypothetical protein
VSAALMIVMPPPVAIFRHPSILRNVICPSRD